ncbi:MAG: NAD-dependent epimerase/dehydratase family protein [Acidimicrobiales bacterium]
MRSPLAAGPGGRAGVASYLVIGAGAIGSGVARALARRGDAVTVASRRGRAPQLPGVAGVAADAADAARVAELARATTAIFNCANPAYHRWISDWPPIAAALLAGAQSSGAVLVTTSNLYAYGRPTGPMSPDDPLSAGYAKAQVRARMWHDALAAQRDGRLRASEVRASDYVGPHAASVASQVLPRLLAGRRCLVLGDPDAPHSWSYTEDVVATLIAAADQPVAWGRAWHAPANPPRSQRELVGDLADAAGVAPPKVSAIPAAALRLVGLVNPTVRELRHTLYQFTAPFVIDDAATRAELRLAPTPWPEVLAATVAAARAGG